jgi:hypothetical protein
LQVLTETALANAGQCRHSGLTTRQSVPKLAHVFRFCITAGSHAPVKKGFSGEEIQTKKTRAAGEAAFAAPSDFRSGPRKPSSRQTSQTTQEISKKETGGIASMFHVLKAGNAEIRINLRLVTSVRRLDSTQTGHVAVDITLSGGDKIKETIKDHEWKEFVTALDAVK